MKKLPSGAPNPPGASDQPIQAPSTNPSNKDPDQFFTAAQSHQSATPITKAMLELVIARPGLRSHPPHHEPSKDDQGPFHQEDAHEWSRVDPVTGTLERGRLDTGRWSSDTRDARQSYGKIVDSRVRNSADGSRVQRGQRAVEVFQSEGNAGDSVQVVRSCQWTTSSDRRLVDPEGVSSTAQKQRLFCPSGNNHPSSRRSRRRDHQSAGGFCGPRSSSAAPRMDRANGSGGYSESPWEHWAGAGRANEELTRLAQVCRELHKRAMQRSLRHFGERSRRLFADTDDWATIGSSFDKDSPLGDSTGSLSSDENSISGGEIWPSLSRSSRFRRSLQMPGRVERLIPLEIEGDGGEKPEKSAPIELSRLEDSESEVVASRDDKQNSSGTGQKPPTTLENSQKMNSPVQKPGKVSLAAMLEPPRWRSPTRDEPINKLNRITVMLTNEPTIPNKMKNSTAQIPMQKLFTSPGIDKIEKSVNSSNVPTIVNENNNGSKPVKKVEFCKTEIHFAPDCGKVNIIETDGKPPPTNRFRRRRRNSLVGNNAPMTNKSDLPVVHFGDTSYEKYIFGGAKSTENLDVDEKMTEKNEQNDINNSRHSHSVSLKDILSPDVIVETKDASEKVNDILREIRGGRKKFPGDSPLSKTLNHERKDLEEKENSFSNLLTDIDLNNKKSLANQYWQRNPSIDLMSDPEDHHSMNEKISNSSKNVESPKIHENISNCKSEASKIESNNVDGSSVSTPAYENIFNSVDKEVPIYENCQKKPVLGDACNNPIKKTANSKLPVKQLSFKKNIENKMADGRNNSSAISSSPRSEEKTRKLDSIHHTKLTKTNSSTVDSAKVLLSRKNISKTDNLIPPSPDKRRNTLLKRSKDILAKKKNNLPEEKIEKLEKKNLDEKSKSRDTREKNVTPKSQKPVEIVYKTAVYNIKNEKSSKPKKEIKTPRLLNDLICGSKTKRSSLNKKSIKPVNISQSTSNKKSSLTTKR